MEHVLSPLSFDRAALVPARQPVSREDCEVAVHHDLAPLAEAWSDLEQRTEASVFQSYAWCSAWAQASGTAGRPAALRVLTVRNAGRLVLLWPLAVHRLGPFKTLQSFGDPATQYCDALVEHGPEQRRWLELAWEMIRTMPGIDAARLTGVRADAGIATLIASRQGAKVTRVNTAPFADFRSSTSPIRRRSGRTRNALQRHLRHLAENGPVAFTMIEGAPARVEAIREAIRLKHAWLSRTAQVSAGYAHPANDAFLEALAARDDFIVARLGVGEETAALEAGFLRGGRYWSLVQSYDGRYALHGPGRLLFWHIMEHAASLEIEVLDFLAPAYPHKQEWANGEMLVRDYVIPLRTGGWPVVYYVRNVRPYLKRWASWLRRFRPAAHPSAATLAS